MPMSTPMPMPFLRRALATGLVFSTATMVGPALADDPPAPATEPPAQADPGPLAPAGFASSDLAALAARPHHTIETIGTSRGGEPIHAITLTKAPAGRKLPALLLVGGMDGGQLASTAQVLAALEALAADDTGLLERVRVFAIPRANPDAREAALTGRQPRAENARRVDDDRDGVSDEDGPRDVDGDGFVVAMRRVAPPGRTATHVVDAADPRIVRAPDRAKGETATHELMVEGLDADGDGRIAEDGSGGVDLDRNFPHRYPEFADDAGPHPLSEPEALAIAKFVRDHPEIATAVVFGRHDTLAKFPDTKDKDFTGRTPMVYLVEDHDLYRDLAKSWKDATGLERSAGADLAGSLVLWLANHRGIAAVAANGLSRPEAPPLPEGAPPAPETGDGEQAAWLAVSDRLYGGRGFIAWRAFEHPTLGPVEIGGFAPFFRESPTAADASLLAKRTAPFVTALAARRPEIVASDAVVTPLADGLARVEFRITNAGNLATTTNMGRIAGVVPPVVVRVGVAPADVLAGRPVVKIDRLAAGESRDFSWIVRMPASGATTVTVSGPFLDTIERTVKTEGGRP